VRWEKEIERREGEVDREIERRESKMTKGGGGG
jgi:hypothetical protein